MSYEELEKDILWVLKHYGSDAEEKRKPGSKIKAQAKRIVEFIRQSDEVSNFINLNHLDLIATKGH